jgi:hypothetical protein
LLVISKKTKYDRQITKEPTNGAGNNFCIKTALQDVGCEGTDWIDVAQERDKWRALVNAVMNFQVPYNAGDFWNSSEPISFSGRSHKLRNIVMC